MGGNDDGGESGTAGDEERFIERLSRLSSLTSSIRDSRLRFGVGEGELVARKSSRSSSRDTGDSVGDRESCDRSSGLRDLDRDCERERERRASSRRTLAALELAIASTAGQISLCNLHQGRRVTVINGGPFGPLSKHDKE